MRWTYDPVEAPDLAAAEAQQEIAFQLQRLARAAEDDGLRADGGVSGADTDHSGIFDRWPSKAAKNEEVWGDQSVETLLLAMQEELGELTQAHLEARAEGEDPRRVADELDDLAALCIQLNRRVRP